MTGIVVAVNLESSKALHILEHSPQVNQFLGSVFLCPFQRAQLTLSISLYLGVLLFSHQSLIVSLPTYSAFDRQGFVLAYNARFPRLIIFWSETYCRQLHELPLVLFHRLVRSPTALRTPLNPNPVLRSPFWIGTYA